MISVAGQEWSVGRLGNTPIGASDEARNIKTYLGPYTTHDYVQPPHSAHNSHEEQQASSTRPCRED